MWVDVCARDGKMVGVFYGYSVADKERVKFKNMPMRVKSVKLFGPLHVLPSSSAPTNAFN